MRWGAELIEGLRALRGDSRRAVMTVLGVAWGTFAVVGLGAFSSGLEQNMAERAAGMGEGIVIIWPSQTTLPWKGLPEGRSLRLTASDVRRLKTSVPRVAELSPEHSHYARIRRGGKAFRPEVTGVDPDYGSLRMLPAQAGGRFLNPADLALARKVVFLGDHVAKQLFPYRDPVGAELMLAETPFTVVGVLQAKLQESDYGAHDTERVFIPTSTYEQVFGARFVDDFVVRAESRDDLAQVIKDLRSALARSHSFDPNDRFALSLWDTTEADKIRSQAFDAMDLLTLLAGVFTVLVGAIGVGNLMFLVVRRRTSEFGLRMALGARPSWILRGVLIEALFLVALGGLLGFLAAAGIASLVGASPLAENLGQPKISSDLALGVAGLLILVGLAAGWFPARRASRFAPAVALAENA